MKRIQDNKAYLVLEDGTVFQGNAIGKLGTTTGEIAFNTGMTGYQEIFTDPSYFGQILIMTSAHIGNYGMHKQEVESDSVKVSGVVVKKFSEYYSRSSGSSDGQSYFEENQMVGICNLDTRRLVRHIRSTGAMNAIISSEELDIDILKSSVKEVPSMQGLELSSKVACKQAYEVGEPESSCKVALLDLGVKRSIISCLVDRGCFVKVFPMSASADEILSWEPDGIMYGNGPGDPEVMTETIEKVGKLVNSNVPGFGICLGHQIIALSQGLETEKMFNGHRGINHPVRNEVTGKSEITSQNHGFVVTAESVKEVANVELTHVHLNDNTVAGIRLTDKPVFSVQYHPEASAGPHDSRYLFDNFVELINEHKSITV
ncbi:MAG: glutamine-hydrolyzing carbamoyl-phosphate synthase small subunit [Flavobacteriales bacterium]